MGPRAANCPCSCFASGERADEMALRCACLRGVRSGSTALHTAAAAGDVKGLDAGLRQLAAEQCTQQAEASAPPHADQQMQGAAQLPPGDEQQPPQRGEQQPAPEGTIPPEGSPQPQPSSPQVPCDTDPPLDGSPCHPNSLCGGSGGGSPPVELPVDGAGNSPLHLAAAAAQPHAVAILLQHCAAEELERRNCFGLTPLHSLVASPRPGSASESVLRLLLQAGADPFARTLPAQDAGMDASYDDSALSLAAQHAQPGAGAAPLAAALMGAGLDPLEATGTLWTCPLEYACAAGGGCRAGCCWYSEWHQAWRLATG